MLTLFFLFNYYNLGFWLGLFGHSLAKIVYKIYESLIETRVLVAIMNVLVILGEICRYMLYLSMWLWVQSEDKENKELGFGNWMFYTLMAELSFHFIAFGFALVVDAKEAKFIKKIEQKKKHKEKKKLRSSKSK